MNVRTAKNQQKDDVVISVKTKSFSKDKAQNNIGSKQNGKKGTNIIENKRQLRNDQSRQKLTETFDKSI